MPMILPLVSLKLELASLAFGWINSRRKTIGVWCLFDGLASWDQTLTGKTVLFSFILKENSLFVNFLLQGTNCRIQTATFLGLIRFFPQKRGQDLESSF